MSGFSSLNIAVTGLAAAQRAKRTDELAAIDKVPRGLDVHSTLRVALLPPPGLHEAAPRPPN